MYAGPSNLMFGSNTGWKVKRAEVIKGLKERKPLEKGASVVGEMCSICQDEFKEGELTLDLKVCDHHFHSKCIKRWLVWKQECPLCKRAVK